MYIHVVGQFMCGLTYQINKTPRIKIKKLIFPFVCGIRLVAAFIEVASFATVSVQLLFIHNVHYT